MFSIFYLKKASTSTVTFNDEYKEEKRSFNINSKKFPIIIYNTSRAKAGKTFGWCFLKKNVKFYICKNKSYSKKYKT